MVDSRQKGASYERSIVKALNAFAEENALEFTCRRNLNQYQQSGQCDIPIPFHAIECKHYQSGNWFKPAWWKQVCESAEEKIPALIFKFNRVPTRVCIPLHAINTHWEKDNQKIAVLPLDEWLHVLKTNWSHYEAEQESLWVFLVIFCTKLSYNYNWHRHFI